MDSADLSITYSMPELVCRVQMSPGRGHDEIVLLLEPESAGPDSVLSTRRIQARLSIRLIDGTMRGVVAFGRQLIWLLVVPILLRPFPLSPFPPIAMCK